MNRSKYTAPSLYRQGCLTLHQRGVAACLIDGMTNAEIAAAMGRSVKTVECHIEAMKRRLDARNTRQLVAIVATRAAA